MVGVVVEGIRTKRTRKQEVVEVWLLRGARCEADGDRGEHQID